MIYKVFCTPLLNLPTLTCKLISSYLTNRQVKMKFNNKLSQPFSPKAGVPQGSVLAPLFYILYINDKPSHNSNSHEDCLNLFYADDNNIAVSGTYQTIIKKVKKELKINTQYETKWRIKINPKKTKVLVFGPAKDTIKDKIKKCKLTLDATRPSSPDSVLKTTEQHNILGIMFDTELKFTKSIEDLKKAVNRDRASFIKLVGLNKEIKTFLYKCYIQPKLLYQHPIVSFLKRPQIVNMQKAQNKCLLHFIFTWREDGPLRSEAAHIKTRMEAINCLCHKRSKQMYTRLKENLPKWHNKMVEWHKGRVFNPHLTPEEIRTPMDWVFFLPPRPLYTDG